jgi:hypothetical protein
VTFPGSTASIVVQLHDASTSLGIVDKIVAFERDYFGCHMHFGDSPAVVHALVHCFGSRAALESRELLLDAVARDASLARAFEELLDQPLPDMPTFLYFRNTKHSEWASGCRSRIPFRDWVILPGHFSIVGELPPLEEVGDLDELHLSMYTRTTGEDGGCENEPFPNFDWEPLESRPGLGMRGFEEDPKLFDTISFLWHATDACQIAHEQVEAFAFANSDDVRVVVGYLVTARRLGWPVDVVKWTQTIVVRWEDDLSIYAGSLLLGFVAADRFGDVRAFTCLSLNALGMYFHDIECVVGLLHAESGMRWLFLRSIIGVDVHRYATVEPLLISEFMEKSAAGELIGIISHQLDYEMVVSAFDQPFLFNRADMVCRELLPTNCQHPWRFLVFRSTTQQQPPVALAPGIADAFIAALRRVKRVDYTMLTFMLNLAATPSQYEAIVNVVLRHFPMCPEHLRRLALQRDQLIAAEADIAAFLDHKPPSYFRAWHRVLRRTKMTIDVKTPSVHPALCFGRLRPVVTAEMKEEKRLVPLTLLELEWFSDRLFEWVAEDMLVKCQEAVWEFEMVLGIEQHAVQGLARYNDAEAVRLDFATKLLNSAVDAESNLAFANLAITTLIKKMPLPKLVAIIINEGFINDGELHLVTLVFRKLQSAVVLAVLEEDIAKCMRFRNPKLGLIGDPEKQRVFLDVTSPRMIHKSLTYRTP